jgi:hypothetical protein
VRIVEQHGGRRPCSRRPGGGRGAAALRHRDGRDHASVHIDRRRVGPRRHRRGDRRRRRDPRGRRRVRPPPVRQRVGRRGNYQVGIRVAHALGRPIVSGIKGVEVTDGTVSGCVARFPTATRCTSCRLPAARGQGRAQPPALPGDAGAAARKKAELLRRLDASPLGPAGCARWVAHPLSRRPRR